MGCCVPERDVPIFIELYKQGRLPIDRLKSGTLPLADINTASTASPTSPPCGRSWCSIR